jgi:hypothetical protein
MKGGMDIAASGLAPLPPVDEHKVVTLTPPPPPVHRPTAALLTLAPPSVHEPTAVTLTPQPPSGAPEEPEQTRVLVIAPRGDDSGLSATVMIRRARKTSASVPPLIPKG